MATVKIPIGVAPLPKGASKEDAEEVLFQAVKGMRDFARKHNAKLRAERAAQEPSTLSELDKKPPNE